MKVFCRNIAIGMLFALIPAAANAAPVIDQQNTVPLGSFAAGEEQAQTFTVGLTGQLTSIDIFLRGEIIAPGPVFSGDPLTVRLLPTVGGAPDNDVSNALGTVVVAGSSLPTVHAFHNIDFSSFNINVTAGDELAWQIIGNYSAPIATGDTYTGGSRYCRGTEFACTTPNWLQLSGQDFGFRTYVDTGATAVPAPGAVAILGLALAGVGLARRRHAA